MRRLVRRSSVTAIPYLCGAALALCSACQQSEIPKGRVLTPGAADYPTLNPDPQQVVKFIAVVPAGLSSEFHLHYFVDRQEDPNDPSHYTSPPGCDWTQKSTFAVDMPLKLEKAGDTYKGSFALDHFQPGPCGWHLDSITSPNYGTGSADSPKLRLPFLWFLHSDATTSHPAATVDLTTEHIHLWCTHRAEPPPQFPQWKGRLFCSSPDALRYQVKDVPADFWASIRTEEFFVSNTYATQYLRSLTVEFHDLDAMLDAYPRIRPDAGGAAPRDSVLPAVTVGPLERQLHAQHQ
jgi:hypothetical protein